MLKHECFKMVINEQHVTWNSLQVLRFQCQLRASPRSTMEDFIISTQVKCAVALVEQSSKNSASLFTLKLTS